MGFDISKFAKTMEPGTASGPRDIETITGEIIQLKQDAGNAILGIGDRLIEAKSLLSHGEWLPWLTEQVEFSESTAQRFMRLSREWRNPSALTDLGATKALTLLALSPEERESFMSENHIVDGEEKSVIDMTSRELERAIRERDEALQAANAAKAEAQAAEESRSKMAADMRTLENIHRAAWENEALARRELKAVREELQALRDKPVDVAVETVVDKASIERARQEAVVEMQKRLDAAEAARKAAEENRKSAEKDLAEARKQVGANAAILSRAEKAEAELAEARRQLEAAARAEGLTKERAIVSSDPYMAEFKVYFEHVKDAVNRIRGLMLKARTQDDREVSEKLSRAILVLGDAVKEAAK